MSQDFGREIPKPHAAAALRKVARYLVVIPAPDGPIAKLLDINREPLAELDANTEEVTTMLKGIAPVTGAGGKEWDTSLAGHSATERAACEVFTLDL